MNIHIPEENEPTEITSQLPEMSFSELLEMKTQIKQIMRDRKTSETIENIQKLEDRARLLGFKNLEAAVRVAREINRNFPRYCNPNDPNQTWTGYGRRPLWLKKYIAEGGSLEDTILNEEMMNALANSSDASMDDLDTSVDQPDEEAQEDFSTPPDI